MEKAKPYEDLFEDHPEEEDESSGDLFEDMDEEPDNEQVDKGK